MSKKGWRSLRAQATIFFVLGIVLFAVFAFALYARSLIVTDKIQQKAEIILTDTIQSNNLNYYVEGCLDTVTERALITLGQQGGKLSYEDTDIEWTDYFTYQDPDQDDNLFKITYAIRPNDVCEGVISTNAPIYPRERTWVDDYIEIYDASVCQPLATSGFVGRNAMPRLCYSKGPNSPEKSIIPGLACEPATMTSSERNIQNELQAYITEQLKRCVDFTIFEETFGYNISVDEDRARTTVTYAKNGVLINTTYPFNVSVSGNQRTAYHSFSHTSNVRLRMINEYATNLISYDNKYVDFDIAHDYGMIAGYQEDFYVEVLEDVCLIGTCVEDIASHLPPTYSFSIKDKILRITDNHDPMDPYVYQVAIKNRLPVLDYIHETYEYDDTDLTDQYDLVVAENTTLRIVPQGYDPDDDLLTYTYAGWREDYNEIFEPEGCCEDDPATEDRIECPNFDECVTQGSFDHDDDTTTREKTRWMESDDYIESGKDANLSDLTRSDVGSHEVTVFTTDESGLQDWQDLRILVFDLPIARPQTDNMIEGIHNRHASIEDPYMLDARNSTSSMVLEGTAAIYRWSAAIEDYEIFTDQEYVDPEDDSFEADHVIIPNVSWEFEFYDFTDLPEITDVPMDLGGYVRGTPYTGNLPQEFELTLQVGTGPPSNLWSDPVTYAQDHPPPEGPLVLHECLPVRGTNQPPWPYSPAPVPPNIGMYDHICCLGETNPETLEPAEDSDDWGTLAGTTTVCYDTSSTGALWRMPADDHYVNPAVSPPVEVTIEVLSTDGSPLGINLNNPSSYRGTYDNDPFTRMTQRFCDNERGNTCTGHMEDTYQQLAECADYGSGEVERCSGVVDDDSTECTLFVNGIGFERDSFEYFWDYRNFPITKQNGETPDGVCNPTYECSSPGITGYGEAAGVHSCQGGCSGANGCVYGINCACDQACGASCEEGDYVYNTRVASDPFDDTCASGCSETTCMYTQDVLCPESTLCSYGLAWNPGSGQYRQTSACSPTMNKPPGARRYCYEGSDCTAEDNCVFTTETVFDPWECGFHDENGCHEGVGSGILCPNPGTVIGDTCYYYPSGDFTGCSGTTCGGNLNSRNIPGYCGASGGYRCLSDELECCNPALADCNDVP